jgi:hypothetical protein
MMRQWALGVLAVASVMIESEASVRAPQAESRSGDCVVAAKRDPSKPIPWAVGPVAAASVARVAVRGLG